MNKPSDKKAKNPLLDEMERVLQAELKDLSRKRRPDELPTPLLDKLRIYDRALKLASLRMKIDDDSYGSGFEEQ